MKLACRWSLRIFACSLKHAIAFQLNIPLRRDYMRILLAFEPHVICCLLFIVYSYNSTMSFLQFDMFSSIAIIVSFIQTTVFKCSIAFMYFHKFESNHSTNVPRPLPRCVMHIFFFHVYYLFVVNNFNKFLMF